MRQLSLPQFAVTCAAIVLLSSACAQQPVATGGPLVIEKQGSFFVGGRDVHSDTLSTLPQYAPAGTITVDQMYVRYQVPVNAKRYPITLIHGCCLTGKTWETTPDGRMGWDEYFVRRGYATYVIDQAWRGRSGANPSAIISAKLGRMPPDQLPPIVMAAHEDAWAIFRFGPEYPKVFPGMQFPLEAQAEFWKQMVLDWNASLPVPVPTVPALSELAIRLNGTVLVSHSQSGIHPFQAAALSTKGIAAIVSIEPGACPAATGDLSPYLKMPILVLFGDYVDLSPRWAPRLRMCRDFVRAAATAGGRAELVVLPDIGIRGASHMLMQDRNSLEIADWLLAWISRNVE
ncbi:MAG TPA: esterase [Burkholderiales bacterium]|nr:esterase [Burkholderiales bacterium]